MVSKDSKKQKFQQPAKKNRTPLIFGIILVVALIAVLTYQMTGSSSSAKTATKSTYQTGNTVAYAKTTPQKDVTSSVESGQMVVSLDDVKTNNFVRTFYDPTGKNVPITAYLSTKGNLVVAVSVCEPCNGNSFRIEGDKIICNVCGTTWDLNTLKGISGGCTKYPPETLNYKVDGNKILIDEAQVKNWQPRALS